MPDIVEIALDGISDFSDFEKVACEVVRNEGYPDIRPLGGVADEGQDAAVERFYEQRGRKWRIVFQITTQESMEAKLRKTISRLEDCGVDYTQLTIVTSRALSSERQAKLKITARELEVALDIIERKTLVNRLSDFENGIFYRHFPDIEKQVQVLIGKSTEQGLDARSVARSALAFTACGESERARTRVLQELVLGLLVHLKGEAASPQTLSELHHQLLREAVRLAPEQISAALDRWVGANIVERTGDGTYRPTESGLERSLASAIDWRLRGKILASDVADLVEQAVETELDSGTRGLVERNASEALGLVFRLMGLEISSQLLGRTQLRSQQVGSHEAIVDRAKRDLSPDLGRVLIAGLAELMANPNEEQAEALRAYACGYIGASLIEVDPAVREFQITRLQEKVFVLDTDFLVDCLVVDRPVFRASLGLVQAMVEAGIRVVVPDACVGEAALHASLAHQTVGYFGPRIYGLSRTQAMERVQNAFALGWYFRSSAEPMTFERYIANYYEPSAPVRYMERVVGTTLPSEVEIGDVTELLGVNVDEEQAEALSKELLELIRTSLKSRYRSEEQMATLANTDARLYMAAMAYEARTGRARRGRALGGSCYLITASLRFIRAVERALRRPDEISARPNTLAALFQLVGKGQMAAKDFVALFDNPLLQHVVSLCREDVEELLDAGLSTRGKNLARLMWDLDSGLHAKIAAVRSSEKQAEETLGDEEGLGFDRSYLELVNEARDRGYRPLPAAERMMDEITKLSAEKGDLSRQVDELTDRVKEIDAAVEVFGRRKQRYLRKIARGEPHHKAY